ncbi:hypothetical protein QBC38DRAFT_118791 [Podospora fimiseda]|uniref:Uncharacterized protein n=1 Tax=Podospora fimiseda TaxID=252190 RepID=A0AAN7BTG3_9PEZI|nr:hypothetical protein QBC38DRAFT_118791 [Podospora fimiseda]
MLAHLVPILLFAISTSAIPLLSASTNPPSPCCSPTRSSSLEVTIETITITIIPYYHPPPPPPTPTPTPPNPSSSLYRITTQLPLPINHKNPPPIHSHKLPPFPPVVPFPPLPTHGPASSSSSHHLPPFPPVVPFPPLPTHGGPASPSDKRKELNKCIKKGGFAPYNCGLGPSDSLRLPLPSQMPPLLTEGKGKKIGGGGGKGLN